MNIVKRLTHIPKNYFNIIKYYGNPYGKNNLILNPNFFSENIKIFSLPYPLRTKNNEVIAQIQLHMKIGNIVIDAFKEIKRIHGVEYLQQNELDIFGCAFQFRKSKDRSKNSLHNFGISIDLNPQFSHLTANRQPDFIREAFTKRGFIWGGKSHNHEGDHFQAGIL